MEKPKHPFEEEWYSKVSHDTQTVCLQVYFDELSEFKKKTHGGERKGAGRTPGSFVTTVKKEPTKVMRIPISKEQAVKDLIKS